MLLDCVQRVLQVGLSGAVARENVLQEAEDGRWVLLRALANEVYLAELDLCRCHQIRRIF